MKNKLLAIFLTILSAIGISAIVITIIWVFAKWGDEIFAVVLAVVLLVAIGSAIYELYKSIIKRL